MQLVVELGLEIAQLLLQLSHAHHDDVLGLQRAHRLDREEELVGLADVIVGGLDLHCKRKKPSAPWQILCHLEVIVVTIKILTEIWP